MKKPKFQLKAELEALYARYNDATLLQSDPLGLVDRLLAPDDFEIVSFLFAGLSYGRVEQIQKSSRKLLENLAPLGVGPGGEGIAEFLKKLRRGKCEKKIEEALSEWKHRMNTPSDMSALLMKLSVLLQKHDSLCGLFQSQYVDDPCEHIALFSKAISGPPNAAKTKRGAHPWSGTGLSWFATSPRSGGTCKRLMMWLRWMIREDAIDPGLWTRAPLLQKEFPRPDAARLFWPVDTHIFQWAKLTGATRYASPNWKMVQEITNFFRALNPTDPVKYDFAICHTGMDRLRALSKAKKVV